MAKKNAKNLNLKSGLETLTYYREVEPSEDRYQEIEFIRNGKKITFARRERNKIIFTEEIVEYFSLDRLPYESLPPEEGNYVMVANYLIDFWTPILGPDAVMVYIALRRHCYGKDYCYISNTTLHKKVGLSKPTLLKALKVLEKYGFIFQFKVLGSMGSEAPLTKIRLQIPIVPLDLILMLPEDIQLQHKTLIEKLEIQAQVSGSSIKLQTTNVPVEVYYDALLKKGNLQEDIKAVKSNASKLAQLKARMNKFDHDVYSYLVNELSKRYSDKVIKTFVSPLVMHYDYDRAISQSTLIIYTDTIPIYDYVTKTLDKDFIELFKKYLTINYDNAKIIYRMA